MRRLLHEMRAKTRTALGMVRIWSAAPIDRMRLRRVYNFMQEPTKILALTLLCFSATAATAASTVDEAARQTTSLVSSRDAQALAAEYGLQLLNVLWEDTGRAVGSSVGPNISDVTIEADTGCARYLMPVIRFPNFKDKTGDVQTDKFMLRVGNENGRGLHTVSLTQFLKTPERFMSLPGKGKIKGKLWSKRDSHVLVSAQTTLLPVPQKGSIKFSPVIFNYQSQDGAPAVLTLLVTRQGTSMTVVENSRDRTESGMGQRLYFNESGQRAPLTAERLSDVVAKGETSNGEDLSTVGADANLLMLIQVPLKYPRRQNRSYFGGGIGSMEAPAAKGAAPMESSSMDVAVLGHGPTEGPFTELNGLTIERDDRFPIRVTVQFYQATTDGKVTAEDMQRFAKKIDRVYESADYVGSLVVPEGLPRPTEHNVDYGWNLSGLKEWF